jgi:serine/threonine protein kinase
LFSQTPNCDLHAQLDAREAASISPRQPRWTAPEALRPGGAVGAASDVYSFGIVMYEVLTWRKPFGGLADEEVGLRAEG